MFKIAILGCENSHADAFLEAVIEQKIVDDVEFVGVYSDDKEAAQKLHDRFGVAVADDYDAFVGQVDGIIVTARNGANHYKYAKPYLASGIPMFIDKPITNSEEDAAAFMAELKKYNIRVTGGSVCPLADYVQELKKAVQEQTYGKVLGGYLRAPVSIENAYGNFFFYSQHLVQILTEVFGLYPNSVKAFQNDKIYTCIVRYDDFDVTIEFTDGSYVYYAGVSFAKAFVGKEVVFTEQDWNQEFLDFHDLLLGKPQKQSYEDFFAPVYILNAIERSLKSGKEEVVNR